MAFYHLSWQDIAAIPFPLFWQLHDEMTGTAIESRLANIMPVDAAIHSGKWELIDEIVSAGYIEIKTDPISPEIMDRIRRNGTRIAAAVKRDMRKIAKGYKPIAPSSQMPPQNPPAMAKRKKAARPTTAI